MLRKAIFASPYLMVRYLPEAKSFKYLGVFILNNFSWDFHIETITITQRLGMMKHVPFDAPRRVKRVAYLTLCRPRLEHACEVWDPHLARQVSLLKGVQRKANKFILGIKGSGSSHTPLIKSFIQIQNNIHSYQTRSVLGGAPLAVCANTSFYLHSFLLRTSRDLRGLP